MNYYWHLVVKNGRFHIATDIWWSTVAISHCYWHLVVNSGMFHIATDIYWLSMSNFELLLTFSGQVVAIFTLLLTSGGQQWQISQCYCHLVINIWQFWHYYWHLVVKNKNFTFPLTSSGWRIDNFHNATDI